MGRPPSDPERRQLERECSLRLAATCSEARRLVQELDAGAAVLRCPLPEEFGMALAQDLAEQNIPLLLLVPPERFELILSKTVPMGILTLPDPPEAGMYRQAVGLLLAQGAKLAAMRRQTESLQDKMAEIRLAARAKLLLMEHEHLSEGEAHRRIEKLAMDQRIPRRQAAVRIIHQYD